MSPWGLEIIFLRRTPVSYADLPQCFSSLAIAFQEVDDFILRRPLSVLRHRNFFRIKLGDT